MNNLRNSIQLIGNLGSNPEIKEINGGRKLAKVAIATKDIYHNANGEKVVETSWHNIVAWGKVAENMEVFLRKGNEVAMKGKLQHRNYIDKDGNKRNITEILVKEFMLLSKSQPKAEA